MLVTAKVTRIPLTYATNKIIFIRRAAIYLNTLRIGGLCHYPETS